MNDYFDDRIIEPTLEPEDLDTTNKLMPLMLSDFIGQSQVKENLSIYM